MSRASSAVEAMTGSLSEPWCMLSASDYEACLLFFSLCVSLFLLFLHHHHHITPEAMLFLRQCICFVFLTDLDTSVYRHRLENEWALSRGKEGVGKQEPCL